MASPNSCTANAVTGRMDNDQEKIRKRKALSNGELGRKLDILEKNIKPNCSWITGGSMGLADIAIWRLMGWLSSETLEGVPATILISRPKIQRVCQNVDANPKIQQWIQLTYQKDYNRGNYR